jgi:hypothetical protein
MQIISYLNNLTEATEENISDLEKRVPLLIHTTSSLYASEAAAREDQEEVDWYAEAGLASDIGSTSSTNHISVFKQLQIALDITHLSII